MQSDCKRKDNGKQNNTGQRKYLRKDSVADCFMNGSQWIRPSGTHTLRSPLPCGPWSLSRHLLWPIGHQEMWTKERVGRHLRVGLSFLKLLPSCEQVHSRLLDDKRPCRERGPFISGVPLRYSCPENPMDGRAWWAAVHGAAKSQTRLSNFTFTFHFHALEKEMTTHSSVLAWRIPGVGEPGGLPSMVSHRVGHNWSDLAAAGWPSSWMSGPSQNQKKNHSIKWQMW